MPRVVSQARQIEFFAECREASELLDHGASEVRAVRSGLRCRQACRRLRDSARGGQSTHDYPPRAARTPPTAAHSPAIGRPTPRCRHAMPPDIAAVGGAPAHVGRAGRRGWRVKRSLVLTSADAPGTRSQAFATSVRRCASNRCDENAKAASRNPRRPARHGMGFRPRGGKRGQLTGSVRRTTG